MPEAYWAAIATLIVIQSTLGATLTLSIERIVATAVGASVGALEANYFRANLVAFAVAIFLIGLLSIAFRLEKNAYRYASITLAIIVLIPRSAPAWIHRAAQVPGSLSRYHRGPRRRGIVAGTSATSGGERRRVITSTRHSIVHSLHPR